MNNLEENIWGHNFSTTDLTKQKQKKGKNNNDCNDDDMMITATM